MAGYNDTRDLIISALMGRPAGTEIQPENHQAYALNMLDYIRSVELVSTSTLIGLAEENTVPIQPNDSRVCYIAGVGQDRTVVFNNFIDNTGNPISITTGEMEGVFVILLWNTEHWVAYTFNTNIISSAESANFYYGYNIRKTYASVAAMNADSVNPIGTDGRLIKIGELVTVVNSTTPAENAFYSYEGSGNGWKLQSGFNFEVVQTTGTDVNSAMSQKAVSDITNSEAIQILKQCDSSLIFKGFAKPGDAIPTATLNHAYIVIESGTVYGVSAVEKGQVLVGDGNGFVVKILKYDNSTLGKSVDEINNNSVSKLFGNVKIGDGVFDWDYIKQNESTIAKAIVDLKVINPPDNTIYKLQRLQSTASSGDLEIYISKSTDGGDNWINVWWKTYIGVGLTGERYFEYRYEASAEIVYIKIDLLKMFPGEDVKYWVNPSTQGNLVLDKSNYIFTVEKKSLDKYIFKPGDFGFVKTSAGGKDASFFNVFQNGKKQVPWDYDGYDTFLYDGKFKADGFPDFMNTASYSRSWYLYFPENLRDRNISVKVIIRLRSFITSVNLDKIVFAGIIPFSSHTDNVLNINSPESYIRYRNRYFFNVGQWEESMSQVGIPITIELYYYKDKIAIHVNQGEHTAIATFGMGDWEEDDFNREYIVLNKHTANYAIQEIIFEKWNTETQKERTFTSDGDVKAEGGDIIIGSIGAEDGVIAKIPISQATKGVVEFDFTPNFDPHGVTDDKFLLTGATTPSCKVGHHCEPAGGGDFFPVFRGGFWTRNSWTQVKRVIHERLLNEFTWKDAFSIRIKTTEVKTAGGITYNECKSEYVGAKLSITSTHFIIAKADETNIVNLDLSNYSTIQQLVNAIKQTVNDDFVVTLYYGAHLPVSRLTKLQNLVICKSNPKLGTDPISTINDSFEVFIPLSMQNVKCHCVFAWDNEQQEVKVLINGFEFDYSNVKDIVDTYSTTTSESIPIEFSDTHIYVGGDPITGERYNGKIENIKIHSKLPYGKRLLPLYTHPVNNCPYDYSGNYVDAVELTNNLVLSGLQTIDGVPLSEGKTVWAGAQTNEAEIDAYTVHSGAWTKLNWGLKPSDGIGAYLGGTNYGGKVIGITGTWDYEVWKDDNGNDIVLGAIINQGNPVCRLSKTFEYLKSKGVVFINSKRFAEMVLNGEEMPERCAMIAFDDGGYSTWWDDKYVRNFMINDGVTIDLPIATINADAIHNDNQTFLLNFEHTGNAIASHSHFHKDLNRMSYEEMLEDYGLAKEWFEEKGFLPRVNYYPKGSFTKHHAKCLQHFGFPINFRIDDSLYYRQGGDLKHIGRLALYAFRWDVIKTRIDLFFEG